ncbi:Helicase c2 [Burkholderiales bacterium]|nr:Helicase c2 [Burkholderiales bacterium]
MSAVQPRVLAGADPGDSQEVEARRRAVAAAFSADGALAGALAGYRVRPAQQEMALAVLEAIARRATLAAEAGTGTGKTLAYLVPAVLAGGKVLIAAGTKTLQDQIFDKDLPAVCRALSVRVDTAILKGRQNYLCRLRLERTATAGMLGSREEVQALQHLSRFALVSQTGDRSELAQVSDSSPIWPAVTSTRDNCLGSECEHFENCYVVRARRRALAADVVVVNHHLLLADMALREETDSELLPNAQVVIVDEAHQLARIAAEFFGDDWSLQQIAELCADALRVGLQWARDGAQWPELARTIDFAARAVRLSLADNGKLRRPRLAYEHLAQSGLAPAAIAALDRALSALQDAVSGNQGREAELDLLLPRVQRLRQSMKAWHQGPLDREGGDGLDVVRWVSATAHGAHFYATPLSCSQPFARAREQREQAWIFTSATLTTAQRFEPFLEELGLSGSPALRWDSPFDFARQALLYLPAAMPNPQAEEFAELVAEAAWPVLRASRGRAFVLCSTLRAVPRVARRLQELMDAAGDPLPILVQGEANRRAMLGDFRRLGEAVLVGSVSFWEGIDVRGDALSVVVIDKLPFAPPDDPVVEARIRRMKAQGRNPFREYQLPQAITLLRQGVGRLIRDDSDRGVLMILDERLLSRSYGKTILASLPPFSRTRDEAEACAFVDRGNRPALSMPGPAHGIK